MLLLTMMRKAVRSPDLLALGSLSATVMAFGTAFFHFQEGLRWLDALYFTVITLTTVGYGDISPQTDPGKIFAMIYILVGLGIIAALVGVVADLALESAKEVRGRLERRAG